MEGNPLESTEDTTTAEQVRAWSGECKIEDSAD